MLERVISTAGLINTLLGFLVGLICAYQQTMYVREWLEDHAGSKSFSERQVLSVTALFSASLTERCRHRRRKLFFWAFIFFFLAVVEVLLVRL